LVANFPGIVVRPAADDRGKRGKRGISRKHQAHDEPPLKSKILEFELNGEASRARISFREYSALSAFSAVINRWFCR
jgi:hypothetical protein